ncbi:MAG: 2-hydroxyacyl-CoA dehydratase family protein [Pseudomonadota bacterium]
MEQTVDRILADPLRTARSVGQGIGYVGADVPLDLLLATGRPSCHLPWIADRATPVADQWLESSFPGWARSMLQDWATGRFDCLSQVIFSRGDDSAQRLYYYICELQRRGLIAGPVPLIFDVAGIPRESSRLHTIAAVRSLAARVSVSDAALQAGVRAANRRRAMFERIDTARTSAGVLYERVARASLFEDFDTLLGEAAWPSAVNTGRLLLAGSAPPDERLHQAAEAAGWSVVGETHGRSLARLGPKVTESTADPAAAIGSQRHAAAAGPRGFGDAASSLLMAARRKRARAVVLWLTREEESLVWHVPAQRAALAAAGIPALVLTSRSWNADDGATDEITGFLGGLQP